MIGGSSLRSTALRARRPGERSIWIACAVALGCAVGIAAGIGATPALAVAAAPAVIALFVRPDWLPSVLVVTVFVEAISIGDVSVSRLAGPLAVVVVITRLALRGGVTFPRKAILIAAGLYSAWAFASALWTIHLNPPTAGGTAYALASLALSLSYMIACAVLIERREHVFRLLVVFWAMAVLMGIVAIAEYLSGGGRAVGLSGDANFFAALQIVALPLGVVLATQVRRPLARTAVLVGLAIVVASVVTSLSRGGLLALAGLVLLLALQPAGTVFRTRQQKATFLVIAVLGGGALLAASYGDLSARTSSIFTTADGGSGRTNLWLAAIAGWEERPVTGLGFGAFEPESNHLLRRTPGVDFTAYRLRPEGQVVHNTYLGTLVELGIVGLALFLALLASMVATLRSVMRSSPQHGDRFVGAVARATMLSVAGFAFTAIFLSAEGDRALWVLLGLSLALPRMVPGAGPATEPS